MGRKPIQQGQGMGSSEGVSSAEQGSDIAEHELFSQNSLHSWLGCSLGLEWDLKEAGMSQKARTQMKPLQTTMLLLATWCHHHVREFGCSTKEQDLDTRTLLILSFLLVCQLHSGTLGITHTVGQISDLFIPSPNIY